MLFAKKKKNKEEEKKIFPTKQHHHLALWYELIKINTVVWFIAQQNHPCKSHFSVAFPLQYSHTFFQKKKKKKMQQ